METNKNKISASDKFAESVRNVMEEYYRNAISENIKRALTEKKKLST